MSQLSSSSITRTQTERPNCMPNPQWGTLPYIAFTKHDQFTSYQGKEHNPTANTTPCADVFMSSSNPLPNTVHDTRNTFLPRDQGLLLTYNSSSSSQQQDMQATQLLP
jgi:hypothetical protein